jgi:hypothetical protein
MAAMSLLLSLSVSCSISANAAKSVRNTAAAADTDCPIKARGFTAKRCEVRRQTHAHNYC